MKLMGSKLTKDMEAIDNHMKEIEGHIQITTYEKNKTNFCCIHGKIDYYGKMWHLVNQIQYYGLRCFPVTHE